MIETVAEFIRLVESDDPDERRRSTWEDALPQVWKTLVDDHPEMRFWVAHNRTVPEEILRILAVDPEWRVRHRVASRRSCPSGILELLSNDTYDSVASLVAGHPNAPSSALRRLAKYPWDQVSEKAIRRLTERGEMPPIKDGN
ncbi:hypothetical protein ACN27G_21820 [Plantactinospora sp. WMMB334]|uniref:hypothetical protein n=1 Tax=Plantactinospora sp. WMMB334 TaxID=3404119 RepID=UPI003B934DDE